jgi:hypothetical protein
MVDKIETAFKGFSSNLEITDKQESLVSDRRKNVEAPSFVAYRRTDYCA